VSSNLDVLQDRLTPGSFGLLVDFDFNTIVISQEVVKRIYPELTGQEDARVTYNPDGSVLEDRRNVPYTPADTILQDLTKLTNANWTGLLDTVRTVPAGDRGLAQLNMTLTGENKPIEYYVMFDKWRTVSNWTLLVFAPIEQVKKAADVHVAIDRRGRRLKANEEEEAVVSMKAVKGDILSFEAFVINRGNIDAMVRVNRLPDWAQLSNATSLHHQGAVAVEAGKTLAVKFQALTARMSIGNHGSTIVFHVEDADYPDCLYQEDLILQLNIHVLAQKCDSVTHFQGPYGRCVSYASVVFGIGIPFILLSLMVCYLRKKASSSLTIDEKELVFENPPKLLGTGSFGSVYLANFRGTQVAVKEYNEFSREVLCLAKLRHPCIATLMGVVLMHNGKTRRPMLGKCEIESVLFLHQMLT
jgi:hypothetical protein